MQQHLNTLTAASPAKEGAPVQTIVPYHAPLVEGHEDLRDEYALAIGSDRVLGGGLEEMVPTELVTKYLPGFARQQQAADWFENLIALPDFSGKLQPHALEVLMAAFEAHQGNFDAAFAATCRLTGI